MGPGRRGAGIHSSVSAAGLAGGAFACAPPQDLPGKDDSRGLVDCQRNKLSRIIAVHLLQIRNRDVTGRRRLPPYGQLAVAVLAHEIRLVRIRRLAVGIGIPTEQGRIRDDLAVGMIIPDAKLIAAPVGGDGDPLVGIDHIAVLVQNLKLAARSAGAANTATPATDSLAILSASGTTNYKAGAADVAVLSSAGVRKLSESEYSFIFDGKGWGHGVGASQWGSYDLARAGRTWEEILKTYYTGVTIEAMG